MPAWIVEGFQTYATRLKSHIDLKLQESDSLPKKGFILALDATGHQWNTEQFAKQLQNWQQEKNIYMVIGGADGLSKEILEKANVVWSLSKLTFPHMLVRVIVAEQIYRAWSFLQRHPYHRE